MCIALDMAQEINDKIENSKKKYNELCVKEKVINDMQNDLLHKIEGIEKFDLYEGWKMTKALHELRKERRKIKDEKYNMELFLNNVKEVDIKKIQKANKKQKEAIFEKSYRKRVSGFSDPINDIEKALHIINNTTENDIVSRTRLTNQIKNTSGLRKTKEIYTSRDALPKEKGSCIKYKLRGKQADLHNKWTKDLLKKYERYEILDNNIIYLINRL